MAMGIVDRFKTIQIDQQQRHPLIVTRGQRQSLSQTIFYQRTIGQTGQHIVKRQMLRLRLRRAQLQHRLRQNDRRGPEATHHIQAEQGDRQHRQTG